MARREFQNPTILIRQGREGDEYYIRYRVRVLRMVDGKAVKDKREKWHVLGLCAKMTYRKAEREKARIMKEVNGQVYDIQSMVPFADFVKLYRERRLIELRVPTQRTYDQILRKYIEPYFAGKKLCDLDPQGIHLFLSSIECSPLYRKTIRGVLSSVFNLAIAWGYLEGESPVSLAFVSKKLPGARVREKRIWTAAELGNILLSVRPDVALIIETLVGTGMRISECLGLRWSNVDLARGFIHVAERQCRGDVNAPKSQKGNRYLPLGNLAAKYTAIRGDARPPETLVFSKDGVPYVDCELLANYLSPILRKLGLKFKGSGWHTFRRMHISWFTEQGGSAFETQEQAGHANIGTTTLYVVSDFERRAEIVRKIQGKLPQSAVPVVH